MLDNKKREHAMEENDSNMQSKISGAKPRPPRIGRMKDLGEVARIEVRFKAVMGASPGSDLESAALVNTGYEAGSAISSASRP